MPVPAVLRGVERDDHLVTLSGPDLVIAPRAPVGLDGLVRLHVANAHRTHIVGVHRSWGVIAGSAEQGPGHEGQRDQDTGRGEDDVAPMMHAVAERVHAHGPTLATRRLAGPRRTTPSSSRR